MGEIVVQKAWVNILVQKAWVNIVTLTFVNKFLAISQNRYNIFLAVDATRLGFDWPSPVVRTASIVLRLWAPSSSVNLLKAAIPMAIRRLASHTIME